MLNKHESTKIKDILDDFCISELIGFSGKYQKSRSELIKQLEEFLATYDMIISKESPIDLVGFRDTVFAHFDLKTQKIQTKINKGFVRVVPMIGATAINVPCDEFAVD